jgi:hypothetical protein
MVRLPLRSRLTAGFAAVALLASAVAFLPASRAEAAVPVKGDASWVWYVSASGGSGQAIARTAKRRGLDAVYVKSGDGTNYWDQFSSELVDDIHARGLDVCAWQFVYGRDPAAEARVGARAVDAGADCLIIDAESDLEGRYAEADTYMRTLRDLVGPDYPLGLSSFPYVDYHPSFPYSVFLGPDGAQFNVPQVYWHTIGTPVITALTHTYEWNRPYDVPIYPVGQTYEDPPRQEIRSFRRYARKFGAQGVSWWSWQETSSREWRSITHRVKRLKGPAPDRSFPELTPGATGDLVVWAQELLRGGGATIRVTGEFDSRTERAVAAAQTVAGLPATGEIDDRTWSELLVDEPARVRWAARRTPGGTVRIGAERAPESASLSPLGTDVPPLLEGSG